MSLEAEHRRHLALLGLLTLAAAVRLRGLSRQSLWLDEINQLLTAAHSLSEMFALIRWHASPPLDYVVMHFWQHVGWSEAIVRFPAVVWSVASVGLLYLTVRKLGYETAALSAGTLLALSLPAIAYAQEARMYSLFTFTTTVLLYALVHLLQQPESWRSWALLGLASTLSLYTHYYAALVLVSLALPILTVAAARRSWRVVAMALATGVAVAISYLPWLPSLLAQVEIHRGAVQHTLRRELYFEMMPQYLAGGLRDAWVWVIGGIFISGVLLVTVRSREKGMALAAFTIAPFLLAYWLPPFSDNITPRNLLFLLPGYHVGIAVGLVVPVGFLLDRLLARRTAHQGDGSERSDHRAVVVFAGLAVVLAVIVWPTRDMLDTYHRTGWWMKTDNPDWREAAAYLNAHAEPGDVIITDDRYTRHLLSFYLDRDGLQGRSLERYVQSPYNTLPHADERFRVSTLEAPPALLRSAVDGADNVWFVFPAQALEKLIGIVASSREPLDAGFDVPLVHLSRARAVDSLALSHPPQPPTAETDTATLNLVTWEGWSSQFYLRDGVFLRWMSQHGLLRLPLWSSLATETRLTLHVPPGLAGATLQLQAGGPRAVSRELIPGWQDVTIELGTLPDRNGWVYLELEVDPAPPPPGARSMEIGSTGTPSPVSIVAESATHEESRFADIYVDGELYSWFAAAKGYARGYNLIAVDPHSGEVLDWAVFDTHGDPDAAATMATFIDHLAPGTIVAGAVKDDGSSRLSPAGYRALQQLGCSVDIRNRFRAAHAFVGVKGAPPGTALEDGGGFQGSVAVGADDRGFTVGLSAVRVSVGR